MKYILIAVFAMALNSASGQITIDSVWLENNPVTRMYQGEPFQRQTDTVKVVLLVSDTAQKFRTSQYHRFIERNGWNILGLVTDTTFYNDTTTYWQFGYSVREKHNTDEGQIDPYVQFGYVSRDYYTHLFFLDDKKQPLKQTIIVWQSTEAKP